MKNNKLILFSALALPVCSLFTALESAPLVSIGDTTTIHFLGSASAHTTSNLFRDETNEVDDIVLTVTPGLQLVSGGASNITYGATARYEIRKYDDRGELDTELVNLRAYGKFENARLVANASAAFFESQTNTGDSNVVGALIESETTTLNLDGEYRLSPKFKFGAGVRYTDKDYLTFQNAVADYEETVLPFDLYYELTAKLDASAGYRYADREVKDRVGGGDTSYDTETHFFNVGLRGELMPKLTGFTKVGYRIRERSGFDDTNSLGIDTSLKWATTPKLSNTITLTRDFGVAGTGDTTERTSFNWKAEYSISTQYVAGAGLGYTMRDFQDGVNREDDLVDFSLSLRYIANEYWTFGTGYIYSENDSDAAGRSYENHRFELTASLRY